MNKDNFRNWDLKYKLMYIWILGTFLIVITWAIIVALSTI